MGAFRKDKPIAGDGTSFEKRRTARSWEFDPPSFRHIERGNAMSENDEIVVDVDVDITIPGVNVTIDETMPTYSESELDKLRATSKEVSLDEMKRVAIGLASGEIQVVISPQVEKQLAEMGLDIQEVIQQMIKSGGGAS